MWHQPNLRRLWYRSLAVGPVLLLAALFPQVSYVDHWTEFVNVALERPGDLERDVGHEAHCHSAAAGCADQPIPIGVKVIPAVVDEPEPHLTLTRVEHTSDPLHGRLVSVPTEPPRLAL